MNLQCSKVNGLIYRSIELIITFVYRPHSNNKCFSILLCSSDTWKQQKEGTLLQWLTKQAHNMNYSYAIYPPPHDLPDECYPRNRSQLLWGTFLHWESHRMCGPLCGPIPQHRGHQLPGRCLETMVPGSSWRPVVTTQRRGSWHSGPTEPHSHRVPLSKPLGQLIHPHLLGSTHS